MDEDSNKENEAAKSAVLQQLINDLGIDALSQDKQNELIIKMTEILLKRIFLETMEKLGEQGREEYEKLTVGDIQPEQVEAFFKEKIHNYDEMVKGVIEDFREEMISANNQ